MKAIILTQYFPPEVGAAQNRLMALAKAFRQKNHEITVITALPNYPTGKIFADYRSFKLMEEEIEGIRVIRCRLYVNPSRGSLASLLSFLTFARNARLAALKKVDGADILLWEYPPLFLGRTALSLADRWGAKLITNFADLWTDALREQKLLTNELILQQFNKFERKILGCSLLITGQTDGVLTRLKPILPNSQPILWPNGADPDFFSPRPANPDLQKKYNPDGKFLIGYCGLHGRNHNLALILHAAALLQKESDVHFAFFGDGYEKPALIRLANQLGLRNLSFHPPTCYNDLPELLSLFDLGLVIHRNLPSLKVVRSAKLFELMAMGIPILHCPESEGSEIVRQADAGLVVAHDQPEAIAEAILQMKNSPRLGEWGRNGREYLVKHFDRRKISVELVEKIERAWSGSLSTQT